MVYLAIKVGNFTRNIIIDNNFNGRNTVDNHFTGRNIAGGGGLLVNYSLKLPLVS